MQLQRLLGHRASALWLKSRRTSLDIDCRLNGCRNSDQVLWQHFFLSSFRFGSARCHFEGRRFFTSDRSRRRPGFFLHQKSILGPFPGRGSLLDAEVDLHVPVGPDKLVWRGEEEVCRWIVTDEKFSSRQASRFDQLYARKQVSSNYDWHLLIFGLILKPFITQESYGKLTFCSQFYDEHSGTSWKKSMWLQWYRYLLPMTWHDTDIFYLNL